MIVKQTRCNSMRNDPPSFSFLPSFSPPFPSCFLSLSLLSSPVPTPPLPSPSLSSPPLLSSAFPFFPLFSFDFPSFLSFLLIGHAVIFVIFVKHRYYFIHLKTQSLLCHTDDKKGKVSPNHI